MTLVPPLGESRQVRCTWDAGGRETGNVALKRESDGLVHYGIGAVPEGVRDIITVERGGDAKLIGIGIVSKSSVKVVGIASVSNNRR